MTTTVYEYDDIMANHDYASKIVHGDKTLHGGLLDDGSYQPPRSLNRIPAIEIWSQQVTDNGHVLDIMDRGEINRGSDFFPSALQTKLLLRHGCKDALTRILTVIGIIEGFGNDGIRLLPQIDFADYFVEPIEGTAIAHLHKGLLVAHGQDEAGNGDEYGHDEMWYAIRDRALENPTITDDMYENLPLAPPPGYQGKAKAAREATSVASLAPQFPEIDPMVELTFTALARILYVEYSAYTTFAWARGVLADPEVCAAPEWAPDMVDNIQADEDIHVRYLRCALAEARARTFRTADGGTLPGARVIDSLVSGVCEAMGGARAERMKSYRYRHILQELARHPEGAAIRTQFENLGTVPAMETAA
ncbi:MAG: hypothetical protein OES38_01275 [Gammaproteobacteria bacterium]|nr:hypothetical protein [Gammaproteobacteria bacterium]